MMLQSHSPFQLILFEEMQSHVSHTTVLKIHNRFDNQQKEKFKHAKPKTIKIPFCKVFSPLITRKQKTTRKCDNTNNDSQFTSKNRSDFVFLLLSIFIHLTKLARCLNNAFVLWPTILSFTFFAVRCGLVLSPHLEHALCSEQRTFTFSISSCQNKVRFFPSMELFTCTLDHISNKRSLWECVICNEFHVGHI